VGAGNVQIYNNLSFMSVIGLLGGETSQLDELLTWLWKAIWLYSSRNFNSRKVVLL